jgi:hypothetical protein
MSNAWLSSTLISMHQGWQAVCYTIGDVVLRNVHSPCAIYVLPYQPYTAGRIRFDDDHISARFNDLNKVQARDFLAHPAD